MWLLCTVCPGYEPDDLGTEDGSSFISSVLVVSLHVVLSFFSVLFLSLFIVVHYACDCPCMYM